MAGVFIDPAESFSRALGQGLATFKSYRDEKRQDEDRAFSKQMALKADTRADNADKRDETRLGMDQTRLGMDQTRFGWEGDRFNFEKSRWPTILKMDQLGVTEKELGIEGQRIENRYKPRMFESQISQNNASAAAASASAAATRDRNYRDNTDWKEGREARQFYSFFSGQSNSLSNNGNYGALPMAGHVARAPAVLQALQDPKAGWMSNPQMKADVLALAAPGSAGPVEQKYGWVQGRTGIVDVQPAGNGRVKAKFLGINAKTGRMQYVWLERDAGQLFSGANVRARTLAAIGNDSQARKRFLQGMYTEDPEGFKKFAGRASEIIGMQRSRLEADYKQAIGTGREAAAKQALDQFDAKADDMLAAEAFRVAGEEGRKMTIPSSAKAIAFFEKQGNSQESAQQFMTDIANNPNAFAAFAKKNMRMERNGKPLSERELAALPGWRRTELVVDWFARQN